MTPRIETLSEKKLIGKRLKMSISDNKTPELWKSFMVQRKEITNTIGSDLFSMQIYNALYFSDFNSNTEFTKWAATEVTNFDTIPKGMETFTLPSGLYAVFLFIGNASKAPKIFQYIFETWLPNSKYNLDDRPHFEILGKKYKNNDPASEEEIWIPIKAK